MLVGVDGSAPSRAALAWATQLARQAGAELVVATVDEGGGADPAPPTGEQPPVRRLLLDGEPADALLDAAHGHDVDLVVIGRPRGRSGELFGYGSVAQRLAHRTDLPLAVVPVWDCPHTIDHLVVGTDGSEGSAAALAMGTALARDLGIGLTAVYAVDPLLEWFSAGDRRAWREEVEGDVRSWLAAAGASGPSPEVILAPELRPASAIGHAAAARPGSVAVVGLHRIAWRQGHRPGRVPVRLTRDGDVPVIMVPAASRTASAAPRTATVPA
jgi:nucleotide-binding universal stress UspA family protein